MTDKRYRINLSTMLVISVIVILSLVTYARSVTAIRQNDHTYSDVDVFVGDIEDALTDNIPLTGRWGSIDSILSYFLTGDLSSRRVLLGDDDWLFLRSSDNDTEGTIADYSGTNEFSEMTIDVISNKLSAYQEKLSDRSIEFAVVYGPNKSSIYHDQMPDRYEYVGTTRTEKLFAILSDRGVNAVDPKETLLKCSKTDQTYYRYDTHWNQLGACIACREVFGSWGIDTGSTEDYMTEYVPIGHHISSEDDLANMVGMRNLVFNDDVEAVWPGIIDVDWDEVRRCEDEHEIFHISNSKAFTEDKILLVGDSFRVAMIPTLSDCFSGVYVVTWGDYSDDLLETIDPGYVLLEIVERNSEDLAEMKMGDMIDND